MKLSKSQAHYLKAIHELSADGGGVRIVDISDYLSLSKASVSYAMAKLVQLGLVRKDGERHIHLTQQGEHEAIGMIDKHALLSRFLAEVLGVAHDVACQDACAIEHVVSTDTLCAICRFTDRASFSAATLQQCLLCAATPNGGFLLEG